MKVNEWKRLKEVQHPDKIKEGEYFLMGEKVIEQKEDKIVGEEITYYKLLKRKGKSM